MGSDSPPLLCTCETPPGHWVQLWGPQYMKLNITSKQLQRSVSKIKTIPFIPVHSTYEFLMFPRFSNDQEFYFRFTTVAQLEFTHSKPILVMETLLALRFVLKNLYLHFTLYLNSPFAKWGKRRSLIFLKYH